MLELLVWSPGFLLNNKRPRALFVLKSMPVCEIFWSSPRSILGLRIAMQSGGSKLHRPVARLMSSHQLLWAQLSHYQRCSVATSLSTKPIALAYLERPVLPSKETGKPLNGIAQTSLKHDSDHQETTLHLPIWHTSSTFLPVKYLGRVSHSILTREEICNDADIVTIFIWRR